MENKLQVRNLRISFHTSNGKVQAVRGLDFDLAEGETLAIVGESGSGKSVTSKAILGILAGNSIVESGEIIYDGKDLLKISEEDFHRIRGDKIAMIFQDPMSSLNPIVRIGRQLTEAMLLKSKARRKESRAVFGAYMKSLGSAIAESAPDAAEASAAAERCRAFEKIAAKQAETESRYNYAREAARDALKDIDALAFELEKSAPGKGAADRLDDIARRSRESLNEYLAEPDKCKEQVDSAASALAPSFKSGDHKKTLDSLYALRDILRTALDRPVPDFFSMSCYTELSGEALPEGSIDEINAVTGEYAEKNFGGAFREDVSRALRCSAGKSRDNIRTAIGSLEAALPVFSRDTLDKNECRDAFKSVTAAVAATIDPLAIVKDSLAHTFAPSLKGELDVYFRAEKRNRKILRAYRREKAKHDRIVARGKQPGWQVADAAVIDRELVKANIIHLINRLKEHFEGVLEAESGRDYEAETAEAIEHLISNAFGSIEKITPAIAKQRAIKLMDEVGIAEPHKRYRQYPFEFSGGMRQRIVIAIALAANPDILICDEPTTALDVTIQSQILELINRLKSERSLSVIFITHDLGVVANMADRVAVMYAGKIVEYGTGEDIFYHSAHPYTWALLSSMPDLDTDEKLTAIPGTPPNMIYPPKGDAFAARNRYAMKIDFERQPPMFKISDTHYAATWLLHPDAPKVDPPKEILDRIARMNKRRESNDGK